MVRHISPLPTSESVSNNYQVFYEMLYRINGEEEWRAILRWPEPDLHMKDIEILLRGFAMLIDGADYSPSMVKFLNQFSRKCATCTEEQNAYLQELFQSFLSACQSLPDEAFLNKKNRRFNIALYEAVFTAVCEHAFKKRRPLKGFIDAKKVEALENDDDFLKASLEGTTSTANVDKRLTRARSIVGRL